MNPLSYIPFRDLAPGAFFLDILPALKDGDSHIWTAMPGRGCAQRTLIHPGFIGSRLPRGGKLFL